MLYRSHFSRRLAERLFLTLTLGSVSFAASAQSFTSGDLAVVVLGNGSTALSPSAQQVTLKEFRTNGVGTAPATGNTIILPGTGISRLTMSGSALTEGGLTVNGNSLVVAGYNANAGTANVSSSTAASANRVVGVADWSTGTVSSITSLGNSAFSMNSVRSAVLSGTTLWAAGAIGGVLTTSLGSTIAATSVSSTPGNVRRLEIWNGQLYSGTMSTPYQGINQVGTGLPTASGTTTTNILADTTGSPEDFYFADASTLYIADDLLASQGGGIQKWTLTGTAWSRQTTFAVGGTAGVRGLTGATDTDGHTVLFGTTTDSRLIRLTDLGAASSLVTLATADQNTTFRGIRYLGAGRVAAVPSPSALLPFALGLPLIALRLRRKSR